MVWKTARETASFLHFRSICGVTLGQPRNRVRGHILRRHKGSSPEAPADPLSTFLLDRRLAGCTEATLDAYRYQLRPFQRWCDARKIPMLSATQSNVRAFLAERHEVSRATLFAAAVRLRTFFRWFATNGYCEDPAHGIATPKVPERLVPALHVQQLKALLRCCDGWIGQTEPAPMRRQCSMTKTGSLIFGSPTPSGPSAQTRRSALFFPPRTRSGSVRSPARNRRLHRPRARQARP